jgi:hypothetical protein
VTFTPDDEDNYETVVFDVSVTVNKATPTVTTEPTASEITYGEALSDSILSGGTGSVAGAFAFTSPTNKPNAGTADQSVTFTPDDEDNYETVVFDVSVTVNRADQTIYFGAISGQETTNRVGLAATADSGLSVTFATNGGPASISGGTNLTFTGAGSVSIVASQTGDGNWNAAPNVTNTFSVTKALASVTLGTLSHVYDGDPKDATATTVPEGFTVEFTYDGIETSPINAGSYAVTGTVNNVMYQGSQTGTLVIVRGVDSITFSNTNQVFDGTARTVTVVSA